MTTPQAAASQAAAKDTPTAKDVRDAVAAHDRVPPGQQLTFRSKVIAMARKGGHLRHIPPPWLNGKPAGGGTNG